MRLLAVLLALGVSVTPTPVAKALPEGDWGGAHASLTVARDGGRLDFDCAHGTLKEAIAPGEDGRFDVPGVYVQERPGPVRPDDPAGAAARYFGSISGDTMTLSVRLSGTDVEVGPYTLTRGRLARVVKCQ